MEKRLIWCQYVGFITIGLVSSIIGPMLAFIQKDIQMNYSEAGIILSGQFLGMLFTVFIGGYLADKYGKKPFLLVGSVVLILGLVSSMLSHTYMNLLIWTIVSGIGFGVYEVGINALCSDCAHSNKGSAMNFLHFFFGVGAIFGPILATLCIKLGGSWRLTFALTALLPLFVIFILAPIRIPAPKHQPTSKHTLPYKRMFIWISGLFCFLYVGIEVSIYGWIPAYWQSMYSKSLIPASLTGSIFWFTLTIGRIVCGKFVDKIGFSKFLIGTSFGMAILTLSWSVLPSEYVILVVILLLGLFLAGIFPTLMASVTSEYPNISGEISAFISIFSALGGFFIPSAIGKSADLVGINKVPFIICGLSILLFFSAIVRGRLGKKQ